MKKVLASVIAIGSLAAAATALAGLPAGTGVNGSLHDMTGVVSGNPDAMGRVCVYCHAPHHAQVKDNSGIPNQYPLWNHKFSTANFTPYTWATPDNQAGAGDISDPLVGPSRLCMTCHDGNVAIDEHGTSSGGTWAQAGGKLIQALGDGTRANLTADLSNTHPIGFDYVTVAEARNLKGYNTSGSAGAEIVVPSNKYADSITISNTQGQYNTVTRNQGGKTIGDNLYNGRIMTCASCHEVHNKENATQDNYINGSKKGTEAPNYFLYAKETNSLICLSCHVK